MLVHFLEVKFENVAGIEVWHIGLFSFDLLFPFWHMVIYVLSSMICFQSLYYFSSQRVLSFSSSTLVLSFLMDEVLAISIEGVKVVINYSALVTLHSTRVYRNYFHACHCFMYLLYVNPFRGQNKLTIHTSAREVFHYMFLCHLIFADGLWLYGNQMTALHRWCETGM